LGAKAGRIRAAIGPCIGQDAYEVGPEFEARFRAADPANARFFVPAARADHWQFDLPAYVTQRLRQAGIESVENLGVCTYAGEDAFFSYRRTTHRKEADYGRQLSAILLKN
jgi:copper oxidase (laccase) domain-containing protein